MKISGTNVRILGLMSGTSMDGLDICLCEVSGPTGAQFKVLDFATSPMPKELYTIIMRNINPESSRVDEICQLNILLADWFAQEILSFLENTGHLAESIDLIGSHGQTFWHHPPAFEQGFFKPGSSLQLGDGPWIAQKTGITTISNFRTADMAHLGQGAPLVPFLDTLLFKSQEKNRVLLNIGGMANLTWLPAIGEVRAFDTGPGNALIDGICHKLTSQAYDDEGKIAAQGQIHRRLLRRWLKHPFFSQAPPRSTGRETFGKNYIQLLLNDVESEKLSQFDTLATVTALTSESIVSAIQDLLPGRPDEILVSGGGLHNHTIMRQLKLGLGSIPIHSLADLGLNPDAKEALAFAILALYSIQGKAGNLPAVTGAESPAILGEIAPGKNWFKLLKKIEVVYAET